MDFDSTAFVAALSAAFTGGALACWAMFKRALARRDDSLDAQDATIKRREEKITELTRRLVQNDDHRDRLREDLRRVTAQHEAVVKSRDALRVAYVEAMRRAGEQPTADLIGEADVTGPVNQVDAVQVLPIVLDPEDPTL